MGSASALLTFNESLAEAEVNEKQWHKAICTVTKQYVHMYSITGQATCTCSSD